MIDYKDKLRKGLSFRYGSRWGLVYGTLLSKYRKYIDPLENPYKEIYKIIGKKVDPHRLTTFLNRGNDFEKSMYLAQIEAFFEKYGNDEYTLNGETKTLNQWFDLYNNNMISKQDMNNIISNFKLESQRYILSAGSP